MVAIFVITTIILFIIIDIVLTRKARRAEKLALDIAKPKIDERFILPKGLFHSKSHAWAELLYDGKVRIGLNDFVRKLLGKVDSISIIPANSVVQKGDTLFTLYQGSKHLSIKAPISGKVADINAILGKSASPLLEDPYGTGWVSIIEPTNLAADIKGMSVADEAVSWLRREIGRFRDFIKQQALDQQFLANAAPVGVTLHDGGLPLYGVLQFAEPSTWESFEQQFLGADS